MSFYICYCGNTENNHNFKHKFEKVALVTRTTNKIGEECYSMDAENFSQKTGMKCSMANCTGSSERHGTQILEHKYIPTEYNYREIKFVLPENSLCNKCEHNILEHKTNMTHHFNTKINIRNKQEQDIVWVLNPDDEDKKVSWKLEE